ncbi:MAG: PGPGW domain-containing protein [Candidatus Latescibacterota bacterium]
MKRFFRIVCGILFLILGVIGLFLPVLQGILFIIIGLLILAPESKTIQRLLAWLHMKYPAVFNKAEQIKQRFFRRKEPQDHPDK